MKKTSFKQKAGLMILGIFVSLAAVEILLHLCGTVYLSIQEYRNIKSARNRDSYRILCLGESTTAFEDGHSYPRQLETILNNKNLGIKFSVINKGVPGIYTEGILARLDDNLDKYKPDMVIAMMGINDPLTENKNYFIFLKKFKLYKLITFLFQSLTNKYSHSKTGVLSKSNASVNPEEGNPTFLGINARSTEYYSQGENYLSEGNTSKAMEMFKESINADPRNHEAYAALAGIYITQKEYTLAEEVCLLNKKNNPSNLEVYDDLADLYFTQNRFDDAEEILYEALKTNPFYVKSYVFLGKYNRLQGKYDATEKILKEGLIKMPEIFHGDIYTELSILYMAAGRLKEIDVVHKKALEVNPDNDHLYGMIGLYYLEAGDIKTADQYFAKANRIRETYYNPETAINYLHLRNTLARRGITLVAMQYPMREVNLLKKFLGYSTNILFIDNQEIFLQAIMAGSYDEYFTDKFGGDFGHCTEKGDRLLAENAANAIIEHFFNK